MNKKIFTLANILVIIYIITTHFDIPHKWIWMSLSAVILGVLLVLWNASSKQDGE